MARYRTLEEIFDEEDEFGLLADIKPRRTNGSTPDERNAEIVAEVNDFYERNGRLPDEDGATIEEMKLGTIWAAIRGAPTEVMAAADRNRLLGYGHPAASPLPPDATEVDERSWRDDPLDDEVPESFDDIFDEDDENLSEAVTVLRHVTPASERDFAAHRADMFPCPDFANFEKSFLDMQSKLDTEERSVSPIEDRQELRVNEGDFLIHRGLLAYVAEKTELTRRGQGGKPDQRLRIIFSNGMENDPLMSSFRKALAADKTARYIHRPGLGPLDPDWEADALELTGTIYVARSKSDRPEIREVRNILHKIGVTSQDVRRRVADARNDATFLLADVEIVATYELHNLSRHKVESLLHRFFAPARPSGLTISDRFGRKVHPREWFLVLPEHVGEAVRLISERKLHLYHYNPSTQRIEPKQR